MQSFLQSMVVCEQIKTIYNYILTFLRQNPVFDIAHSQLETTILHDASVNFRSVRIDVPLLVSGDRRLQQCTGSVKLRADISTAVSTARAELIGLMLSFQEYHQYYHFGKKVSSSVIHP